MRPEGQTMPQQQFDRGPPPGVLAQRTLLMADVVRQYPTAFAAPYAADPDAGWLIGRLYLAGQLSSTQRDAAKELLSVTKRYEALLLAPKSVDSVLMLQPRGLSTESDAAYVKRFHKARRKYERLYHALADAGHDARTAVAKALNEQPASLALVRKGLNALLPRL